MGRRIKIRACNRRKRKHKRQQSSEVIFINFHITKERVQKRKGSALSCFAKVDECILNQKVSQ